MDAIQSLQQEAPMTQCNERRAFGGLWVRRERWSLSLWGKLLCLLSVLLAAVVFVRGLHPFLAVTHRVSADLLVVDGWMPTYTLEQAAEEFKTVQYRNVVVVRALHDGKNKYDSGQFVADYIAEHLVQLGVPQERVQTVFLNAQRRDRTYSSALAVKQRLQEQGIQVHSLTIATLGTHARRSRLLYEKAFGSGFEVGVVAFDDRGYDPARWWRSSEGIREVPFEWVAYLYARLSFSPD